MKCRTRTLIRMERSKQGSSCVPTAAHWKWLPGSLSWKGLQSFIRGQVVVLSLGAGYRWISNRYSLFLCKWDMSYLQLLEKGEEMKYLEYFPFNVECNMFNSLTRKRHRYSPRAELFPSFNFSSYSPHLCSLSHCSLSPFSYSAFRIL